MNHSNGTPEIFLSYSREDRQYAAQLAEALKRKGFSVWWDSDIPAGVPYVKYIEKGLKSARCVVVLWSETSTKSRWVRNEADYAAENEILVPVRIHEVELPWEFRNFQTLDLRHWTGQDDEGEFNRLVDGLRDRIEGRAPTHDPVGVGSGSPARPASIRPKPGTGLRLRSLGLAAVLLVLVAGAVWIGSRARQGSGADPGSGRVWSLKHTPLTGDGKTNGSAISPDGNFLVYAHDEDGRFSLRVKQIDTGRESVVVPEDQQGIRSPVFSPDGGTIYFALAGPSFSMDHMAEFDLHRVPLLGGASQKLASGIIGRRFACSPDGKRLVFKRSDEDSLRIVTAAAGGGDEKVVATQSRDISVRCCLAWSADGRDIITTGRDTSSGDLRIIAVPVDGGRQRILPGDPWQVVLDLHELADGSGLLVLGLPAIQKDDLNINLFLQRTGSAELLPLTNDITFYYQVSADRTGRKLALNYYAVKSILRVLGLDRPDRFEDISTDIVSNGRVVWAPDGRLLANRRAGEKVGLVYMSPDGSGTEQVATGADYVAGMALSPDGRTLAYTSFIGKEFMIWLADPRGGSPRRLAADEGNQRFPAFGPQGTWVVYCRQEASDQPYFLQRRDLVSGESVRLLEASALVPLVSPDGSRIAAMVLDPATGQYRNALVPATGGEPEFLELPGSFRVLGWNHEGTGLTCFAREGSKPNLWDVPLSGGSPRRLTDFPAGNLSMTDAAWNAAGDSVVVALEWTAFDALLLQQDDR